MENKKYIIYSYQPIRDGLSKLNEIPESLTLFVLNESDILVGTLTDGDIRRSLIKGTDINASISECMNSNYKYLESNKFTLKELDSFRQGSAKTIPVIDANNKIKRIINFNNLKSILPFNVVIMAGGRGERLKPLTDKIPKPLLKVGSKPILEHNIDRLIAFGVTNFFITVKYLSNQIIEYFGNGSHKEIKINYIHEDAPLGTIGSVSKINSFDSESILVMNSDLLTNIDFEDFYRSFEETNSDMTIASITYKVDIPYAVLEADNLSVNSFKEKPTYTYYSNGGIYLIKTKLLNYIPENTHFNATDLMQILLEKGYKVTHFPILDYWLDIGKHSDFKKAQEDFKHLKF